MSVEGGAERSPYPLSYCAPTKLHYKTAAAPSSSMASQCSSVVRARTCAAVGQGPGFDSGSGHSGPWHLPQVVVWKQLTGRPLYPRMGFTPLPAHVRADGHCETPRTTCLPVGAETPVNNLSTTTGRSRGWRLELKIPYIFLDFLPRLDRRPPFGGGRVDRCAFRLAAVYSRKYGQITMITVAESKWR